MTCAFTFPVSGNFSVPPAEIRDEHVPVVVDETAVRFTFAWRALQVHLIKKRCRLFQINVFQQYFPQRLTILFLP